MDRQIGFTLVKIVQSPEGAEIFLLAQSGRISAELILTGLQPISN